MPLDVAAARAWAEKAAEKNVASSMTRLGMIYHNALGVERDPAQAVHWWSRAAALGDADGQAMLGAAHQLGAGAPRDPAKALSLLLAARKGGSSLADRFIEAARNALPAEQAAEIERVATRINAETVA
jgi:TPR repeat protein